MSKTDAAWISSTLRVKKLGGVTLADLVSSCMLRLNCIIVEKQYGSKQSFSQPICKNLLRTNNQNLYTQRYIYIFCRSSPVLLWLILSYAFLFFEKNFSSLKCQQFSRPLSTYPHGIQRCRRRPSFLSLKQCYFKDGKVRL